MQLKYGICTYSIPDTGILYIFTWRYVSVDRVDGNLYIIGGSALLTEGYYNRYIMHVMWRNGRCTKLIMFGPFVFISCRTQKKENRKK